MRRHIVLGLAAAIAAAFGASAPLRAEEPEKKTADAPANLDLGPISVRPGGPGGPGGGPPSKFRDFKEVTEGGEKIEGLYTLYRKDDHLYAEIKPFQFDQPLIAPIAIAKGLKQAGHPLNFGEEWILVFKRVGDRVQLIRRNIHYKAPAGSPIEKAVKQAYTDSILMSLPIATINPMGQGVLIDLNDVFFNDFAQLGLGMPDRSRTSWHKVKAFPNNLELEVEATYGGGGRGGMSPIFDDGVIDPRGLTVVIHYSLVKLPDPSYRARLADDRVGHFLSALKDFGKDDPDTIFVRQINRWKLEKANPRAKLSPPKKQILWYIEDTVPLEYRPYVEDGITEWNKAFEKIGFQDAIAVRWAEPGRDEFDPEDINYCTFRWIAADSTYAMSGLRSNPISGELIDGDVVFDASWIQAWKHDYAVLTGSLPSAGNGSAPQPLALGRVISPIMAAKRGYGLAQPLPDPAGFDRGEAANRVMPASEYGVQSLLANRFGRGRLGYCALSTGMRYELSLASMAVAARADDEPAKDGDKKDGDEKDEEKKDGDKKDGEKKDGEKKDGEKKDDEKKPAESKLPEELIGQGIKMIVMHEVGHSLGLRHNFKASVMLSPEQLHDTKITREKGLTGSVMDYTPINIAPKGKPQGDYYSTTIGPYDYWAIEYAYADIQGNEAEELKKIASRSPEPGHDYATDEDMGATNDPYVNAFDFSNDTLGYARDRIELATQLMKDLDTRVVRDGESWARLRIAFSTLLNQWGDGAFLASEHVGGQSVSRDHKGTKDARDPVVPIKGDKQREALKFVVENVLSDRPFRFSPSLMRKLTTERWYHWGDSSSSFGGSVGYPLNEEILAIQQIVLGECLGGGTLSRLQNQAASCDDDSKPLTMAEVFRSLTDGIWSDLDAPADGAKDEGLSCSTISRNLQREHLKRLSTMVLGPKPPAGGNYAYIIFSGGGGDSVPADARALARLHLKEVHQKIGKALNRKGDDTTRAHLEECQDRISKVLEAGLDANGF